MVKDMARYKFTLTEDEREVLQSLVQKGGKGYQIKRAQVLLKLDAIPENVNWTYDMSKTAYGASHSMIATLAKSFVTEGLDEALSRKKMSNHYRKVTGEVEAMICTIACSKPPEGRSRWTMQMIADELIRLNIVETISDSAVCDTMKKTNLSLGLLKSGAFQRRTVIS